MPTPSASEALNLDPALVERFRNDLEALTGQPPATDRQLGIAVSGGPDSTALLLMAAAAYPGCICTATVDHGLRPESREEAQMVAALCARLNVPHTTTSLADWWKIEGNLQEQARVGRYIVLAFWAGSNTLRFDRPWRAEWVAVGHHRDDLAETFLMRARRSAGLRGLAAMRAARPIFDGPSETPTLIRPLLNWSRAELAAIVHHAGMVATDDRSNHDPRYDRSRLRALLASTDELPAQRLAQSARHLRDAEDALAWVVDREWTARHRVENYETVVLDASGVPAEIRRRLVENALDYIGFEFNMPDTEWDGPGLDRLLEKLEAGRAATLAGIKATPWDDGWRFTLAPPRRTG